MNCRDVRAYLDNLPVADPGYDEAAFHAHLASCPACAAEAAQSAQLLQVLQSAAADDRHDLKALSAHRAAVAARLAARETDHSGRWRTYAFGVVTVAVLMAIGLLAPWRTAPADAYQLSLGGVSAELAGDGDQLCDLLFALGAFDAGVDVGTCDTTCKVVIFDLRTRGEARLVEAAIRKLNPGDITVDVIPVRYHSTEG